MDFSPRKYWGVFATTGNDIWFVDPEGKGDRRAHFSEPIRDLKIIEGRNKLILLLHSGRLVCLGQKGESEFDIEVGKNVSGIDICSNKILAWSWNDKTKIFDIKGNLKGEVPVPTPLSFLKVAPKTGEVIIVQENMTISICDFNGEPQFSFNLPSPLERPNLLFPNIDVENSGVRIAIAAYEKGLLIFDKKNQALGKIELESPVKGVSLSRDGEKLLVLDVLSRVILIDKNLEVEFEKKFESEVLFARLDQKGERAFILDKAGTLVCYEFMPGDRDREHFLEVKDYRKVVKKSAIWKVSSKNIPASFGQYLKISRNGEALLYGDNKILIVYDDQGNQCLRKSFLTPFDKLFLSNDGKSINIFNSEEMRIINLDSGKEKFLDFYGVGLKSYNSAPDGSAILVFKKNSRLCLYSGQGELVWERAVKGNMDKIQVSENGSHAVFLTNENTVGYLNLEKLQPSSITIDENVLQFQIQGNQLIALAGNGICYGTDFSGGINWSFKAGDNINAITVLGSHLALTGSEGELLFLSEEGELKGEGKIHHASSRLNFFSGDLLEVYFKNKTLFCYNVISNELFWKFHLDSEVESFDLHEMGNRLAVNTKEMIYYYYITSSPDLMDERSDFLEF